MIPSGLKIGDKFTDGNREFVVLETNNLGYISKFVGFVGKTASPTMEIVTEKKESKSEAPDYESMGIRALQDICKAKGLTVRGSKAELIERLKSAV